MRLNANAAALALFFAATLAAPLVPSLDIASARAESYEERCAAARAARADLGSQDEAVRAKAVERLVELDRVGAWELAARGADVGERAWSAYAAALAGKKRTGCAAAFAARAHAAPPAHAKRLMDLARALDPRAGIERTAEETAAEVRRLLDEGNRARCSTGYDEQIALLGHAAMAPLLDGIRAERADFPGGTVECWAVGFLADEGDVPAIRDLLLAGRSSLADALVHMQRLDVPGTTDALLDAVAAGQFGSRILRALWDVPDRARVVKVVSERISIQPTLDDDARSDVARLFQELGARETVPTLRSWVATTRDPDTHAALATALTVLGDPKGLDLLVHVVSERKTRFPCRPSTEAERTAASAPGRLCPDGFDSTDRARAAETLCAIAGKDVFDLTDGWRRRLYDQGPGHEDEDDYLDRAGAAFRKWWDASKGRVRFDELSGRWIIGE